MFAAERGRGKGDDIDAAGRAARGRAPLSRMSPPEHRPPRTASIIGAGFGGLAMAIALKKEGLDDFVIHEKSHAVGGTWRDNVYPGCACDVPSHMYSFSFAPNPDWSATYSPQPEIRAYVERLVDEHDLRRHIRFGSEVVTARFDEATGLWTLTDGAGHTERSRFLVPAMGPLARWHFPDIEGIDRFEGQKIHSAAWDPGFDPRAKRIAAIGTGASAIQFVPELQKHAAKLHVFQRTPPWVIPRDERRYLAIEKRLFRHVPALRELHRQAIYWSLEAKSYGFHRDPRVLRLAERLAIRNIERGIADPALRAKVTPSYTMGCKRVLMSNTYYPALAQPNVELVTGGIEKITERAIVGRDGVAREVDAIVFGTGFDVHEYVGELSCIGRDGRDLRASWAKDGAEAFHGITVSGFPNLFLLVGPNTGLGHNSILFMIECQVRYAMAAIRTLLQRDLLWIDVQPEIQKMHNDALQARLCETVWQTGGCRSWYQNAAGKNTTLYPGFTFEYRRDTARFSPSDYDRRRRVTATPSTRTGEART